MVQKTIGIYGDTSSFSPFNEDTLIMEIGNEHIACLVKNVKTGTITAFEFFKVQLEGNDWDDIFYEIRTNSGLLDKSYAATKVYYNIAENSFIPSYKFTDTNAELFLSLVHGNDEKSTIYHDEVKGNADFVNAYRIKNNLLETVNRNFLSMQSKHVYTSILDSVFEDDTIGRSILMKVQFYDSYFIATVIRSGKLQLMQRFSYQLPEDVLYHLLNIVEKFELVGVRLQLSGFIDLESAIYTYLQQHFTDIYVEEVNAEEPMNQKMGNYPLHYFSPFFNLQA